MAYRMMGGCLGAAWDGPHGAAYASPAVGGPSHVQAFRLGALPEPDRPSGGGAVRLPSLSAWRRRLGETCVRVPASSSNYHEKEDDSNEPRRFHRHVSRTPSPGGWWSPTRRSTGPRRTAGRSLGCSASPWGRRPTPSGARPSPSRPTGAPPSSARWARARPSVRRVTRHRISGSVGRDSEEVPGSTDQPYGESQGGQQHVGKAVTV